MCAPDFPGKPSKYLIKTESEKNLYKNFDGLLF